MNKFNEFFRSSIDSNLQSDSTYFVWRSEYEELKTNIRDTSTRNINIFGHDGSGKTTLLRQLELDGEFFMENFKLIDANDLPLNYSYGFETILLIDNIDESNKWNIESFISLISPTVKKVILASENELTTITEPQVSIRIEPFGLTPPRNVLNRYLAQYDSNLASYLEEELIKLEENQEFIDLKGEDEILEKIQITFFTIVQSYYEKHSKLKPLAQSILISLCIAYCFFFLQSRNLNTAQTEIINEIRASETRIETLVKEKENNIDKYYVASENLNVRDQAREIEGNIIYEIRKGDSVKLIEMRDDWWFIEYDCNSCETPIQGFVHSDYLKPSN